MGTTAVARMPFDLPTSAEFGGRRWALNTDYRDVLRVLAAFEDPNLAEGEKVAVCLMRLYPHWREIPPELAQAAFDAACAFIDQDGDGDGGARARGGAALPRTMDWVQDAPLIFPAVNRAAGFEVRAAAYLHWWTFLGYFMEIRDSTYATVLALRQKRARGKKLEGRELEFWRRNAGICELRKRYTDEELAERERINALLGGAANQAVG